MENEKHWHEREDGRRFRNIPLNLAERRKLMDQTLTPKVHKELCRLEDEFEILWRVGVIFEDGAPR
jgi:hypothetical protein